MKLLFASLLGFLAGAGPGGISLAGTNSVVPATPEAAAEWAFNLPPNARVQALHGVMAGWAESEPKAAMQWALKLGKGEEWILAPLISAWSRKDPISASRYAVEMPEGPQKIIALEQVGQAWGGKNRSEAMGWAEKLEADSDRKAAMGGVVQSWAMQDSGAALKFAEEQKDLKLKEQLLGKVIFGWSFTDRPAAEKWVKDLPDGDLKKAVEKALAGAPVIRRRLVSGPPTARDESEKKINLSFETPAELGKIMDSPLNQSRQDAIQRYVLEWFGRDREKALPWIPAKLHGYVLGVCAGAVAREWSKTDLVAAAAWVRQIPPFFRDFVARMGAEWAADQPKEVAGAVLKWSDDSRAQVVIRGVCETWAKKDPATALVWMEALPVGEIRKGALKGLAIGWSQSDATACRVWSEKIMDENEKKEAKHYIIHGLARSNPREAIAYLKTLPNGESDLNLIYCLGKEWALVDAPAAADWAKSLPAGPNQEAASLAVVRQWVYEDAKRSADWAENIPEKQSRSLAVKAVMEFWVEQNPAEALAWARQIKDSGRQLEVLLSAVSIWGQFDPQEATNWANNLPAGKQKTEILRQLTPIPRQVVGKDRVKVGQDAPPFTTKTVDGEEIKLADYKGKFVLLDFWATWCGPCIGETPNLKAIFEKYGKREDFVLIGLSLDKDPAQPAAYAKENGCGWVGGFLGDWGKDEVTKLYGVRGIPSIWLIGPDGKVVAKNLRGDGIMAAVSGALESKR